MSLDIINARPFRKQVERFHALVILRLMLFCFARHDSELFLQWDLVLFFFDTIMQMIAYLVRFWLLLNLNISCPALRLCCYSLYLSLLRGKPVSFFLLAEKCSSTVENAEVLSCTDSSCTIHVSTDLALNTWGPWRPIRGHIPCILAGRTKARFFLLYSKKVGLTTTPRIV